MIIEFLKDSGILDLLTQPDFQILIVMVVLFQLFTLYQGSNNKSGRSVTAFANKREKYQLARRAKQQLKKQELDKVCLYAGSFANWQLNPIVIWLYLIFLDRLPSLFVPNANPGIQVVGAPGMGKTATIIDRLIASAIDQGHGIFLYDYKYGNKKNPEEELLPDGSLQFANTERRDGQTPFLAAYAARHGYKIRVFAPGEQNSCIINPVDFLRDDKDSAMVETLLETYDENLKKNPHDSGNKFFTESSKSLLVGAILLAKGTMYPDLMMADAILSLPSLIKRINYAIQEDRISPWHKKALEIYLATDGSEAEKGVMAGAQLLTTPFIKHDIAACLIGKTNISLEIGKKEMLIFKCDQERAKALSPMLAANIELVFNASFRKTRKVPLILAMDEYPTMRVVKSTNWVSTHRSKGLVLIYGYQSNPQLEKKYSANEAQELNSSVSNRFWFNPQHLKTAEEWSKELGKKLVKEINNSTTWNSGGGKSRTRTIQYVLEALLEADRIIRMRKYSFIYKNQNTENRNEAFIPQLFRNKKISNKDLKIESQCKDLWHESIEERINQNQIASKSNQDVGNLEEALVLRRKLADSMFPLPIEKETDKENIYSFMD